MKLDRNWGGLPPVIATSFLVLFACATALYLSVWKSAPLAQFDTPSYQTVAQNLRDGRFEELPDRVPAYPVLLLVTGAANQPNRALFIVQLGLHGLTIWMLAVILARLGVRPPALLLFGGGLLLPPYVEAAAMMLAETATGFWLVLGITSVSVMLLKRSGSRTGFGLLGGIAFGLAALTRPVYQLTGLALAVLLLMYQWRGPRTGELASLLPRLTLAVAGTSILIVGGYSYYNYSRYGFAGLTPLMGRNLSTRTASVVERLSDDYAPIREVLVNARDQALTKPNSSHTAAMYIWKIPSARLEQVTGVRGKVALCQYFVRLNLQLIRRAPLNYLQEVARSFALYWFPASGKLATFNSPSIQLLWTCLHFTMLGATAYFAMLVVGTVASRLGHVPPTIGLIYALTLLLILYTAILSSAVEVGNPRYRLPTEPLLVFCLFLGHHLRNRLITGWEYKTFISK